MRGATTGRETRSRVLGLLAIVCVAALATVILMTSSGRGSVGAREADPEALAPGELDRLPVLTSQSLIPGLPGFTATGLPQAANVSYSVTADTPVFAERDGRAVARFAPLNELGAQTVIVAVENDGTWARVLTPSSNGSPVTAQTAGWVHASDLVRGQNLDSHLVVSLRDETISVVTGSDEVVASYDISLSDRAAVPTGVGYLHLRYRDATVGETHAAAGISSLHSVAPGGTFTDRDGTAVGLHYERLDDGSPGHGAIALTEDAAAALARLPLGTIIVVR